MNIDVIIETSTDDILYASSNNDRFPLLTGSGSDLETLKSSIEECRSSQIEYLREINDLDRAKELEEASLTYHNCTSTEL